MPAIWASCAGLALGPILLAMGGVAPAAANDALQIRAAPCGTPIKVQVGTIDGRFGIDRQYAAAAIAEAAGLWNAAAGSTVIQVDAAGGLPVNFDYDTRQKITQDHAAATAFIRQSGDGAGRMAKDIAELREKIEGGKAALHAAQESVAAMQTGYNAAVTKLNNAGGATPEQARALDDTKLRLNRQIQDFNERVESLDSLVAQERAQVDRYNAVVGRVNAQIAVANRDVGKDFVTGLYQKQNGRTSIEIFAFADPSDLVVLLAHEFGHALGLEHSRAPGSVMTRARESGGIKTEAAIALHRLSNADATSLASVCAR